MKVIDIMSTQVDFVTTDTSVKEISRLIFGRGINGVPFVKERKVVGFITEKDILAKFYPSMSEYMEDPVHTSDFENLEKRVPEILSETAETIMNKKPTTVFSDTPLLRAHSIMILKKVGRLPVVDKKGNLIGIVSKGDIFRGVVGDKLNIEADEEYNDWLSKHYFVSINWKKRLSKEIPDLVKVFKKEKVKDVLDVGCGIGMHSIALAKAGFRVYGFERSELMIREARNRLSKESKSVQGRVTFMAGEFEDSIKLTGKSFDAAIFMGNSICHNPDNYKNIISLTTKALTKKSLMIFQIRNYRNIFERNQRISQFRFAKGNVFPEHAFIEYFDPPRKGGKTTLKTSVIFDFDGKRWKFYGLRNSVFANISKKEIEQILKRFKFSKISFYGSYSQGKIDNWDFLFRKPFKEKESDWLNVIAKSS